MINRLFDAGVYKSMGMPPLSKRKSKGKFVLTSQIKCLVQKTEGLLRRCKQYSSNFFCGG